MKVIYLKSALEDLKWFFYYYDKVFSQGRKKAHKQFYAVESIIEENPYIGHVTKENNVREFCIPRIPFSVIYQIIDNRIEILHVWDERRDREESE